MIIRERPFDFYGVGKKFQDPIFQKKNILDRKSSTIRFVLLAHLSQRLIGELIVYQWSGVRRRRRRRRRPSSVVHNAQTSSSHKPVDRSKPNFMWSLLG